MFFDIFTGLPLWVQVLFWAVLAITVSSFVSVTTLLVFAARFRARVRGDVRRDPGGMSEERFLWVFLVPALNEEVTIADSVARLRQVAATHVMFLVINDGSDDRTGEILDGMDDPRLRVLTRTAPHAREGKAAALNAAYAHVRSELRADPALSMWDEDHVIVVVVDADGRLDPEAPRSAARHFHDGGVGGVQSLVRIYNRRGWLTWAQDVEFSSFGLVFQAGRAWWGTANMGGNGQFNRLSALASIDDGSGPWRDRLTEDQDLGVRLIQAGWAGVQDNSVAIDQQGLNSLRRLYRQRVRWAQGSWQALELLRGIPRLRVPFLARVDSVYYLLTPALQLLTGFALVVSVVLAFASGVPYRPSHWWILIFFMTLSFGPGVVTLALRGGRWYSPFVALVLVIPYTAYSWIVFPVLAVGLFRQLSGRTSWAKTARETQGMDASAVGDTGGDGAHERRGAESDRTVTPP
ncbi:putative N-acetyl-glucosamine transferase [Microbacterium sp. C448]|uniref:glycosyltransferase family 2 protein n=1 Tax=Microbacterium sp. C448 TaxID=1177594 RepID=UPI0003DE6502|nr:glycosyltransferase family 2 protein [Microbacterium sp. C448]CDK01464.1 putative N-acetyl-glucosamine transferase [Microbacterium sp. C448]